MRTTSTILSIVVALCTAACDTDSSQEPNRDTGTEKDAGIDDDAGIEDDADTDPPTANCEDLIAPDCCGFDSFRDEYTDTVDIGTCPNIESVLDEACSQPCAACVREFRPGTLDCGYERYICAAGEWHMWGHFEMLPECGDGALSGAE